MGSTTYDWSPVFQAAQGFGQRFQYQKALEAMMGGQSQTGVPQQPQQNPTALPMPAMTVNPGSIGGMQLPTQNIPSQPAPAPPQMATPQAASNPYAAMIPMLKFMDPSMGMPLLMQMQMKQAEHQQNIQDRAVKPISDEEAKGLGLRPGGVYGRDISGNIVTVQPSDMKSSGAVQQQQQEDAYKNQLPVTPYQKQALGIEQQNANTQAAALNKPIDVSFGGSLVNPKTGQVLYTGAPDQEAVKTGVDYFVSNGTFPPNARSPAMQQAIMGGVGEYLKQNNLTMDDITNKRIGIHARQGAAVQTAKQQAGTMINEDTVSGGMNILNGLLSKGAASPSSIKGLNDLDQWVGRQNNNADSINLRNAIGTISNEYARVMTGTTGGTPSSDSARNEAASRLLTGYNKGTMQSVMGQMHYEMRQRSSAQGGALKQLTGGAYGGVGSSIPYNDPTTAPKAPSVSNW